MKVKSVIAAVALLSMPAAAVAAPVTGQISLAGYAEAVGSTGMGGATGIDFANGASGTFSGTSGGLTSFGAGSGSFAGLTCASVSGGCGTIQDIASFASEPPTTSFLTLITGGPTISFDLTDITSVTHTSDPNGGSLTFTADGIINFSGYDSTAGDFILTAQGNNIVSFSATELASAVPEPSTWAMMILGFCGIGFMAYRRNQSGTASVAA